MRYCRNCGNELEEGAIFCRNCGQKVDQKIKQETNHQRTANNTQQPSDREYVRYNADRSNPRSSHSGYRQSSYQYQEHNKLYRSRDDRWIAGVAGGLGRYFNIDSNLIRVGFIFMMFAYGTGFFAYLLMALLIPKKPE